MSTNDVDRTDESLAEEAEAGADGDAPARGDEDDPHERLELAARAELLAEENRRLREEYVRARRSSYRRTALGLAVLGVVSALGGLALPDAREVLFSLAAVGLFGGLLTYYLTPERFVAADVGERVYAALAANGRALVEELGLGDDRVYVPGDGGDVARLFVPSRSNYDVPDDLDEPIVVDGPSRGVLLEPAGAGLFREFERASNLPLESDPERLAVQLADALVEQFELARAVSAAGGDDRRVTVAVSGSSFGDVDRFDHPIASFFAVGVAAGLERPVTLDVSPGDDRADWLVTCRWESEEG